MNLLLVLMLCLVSAVLGRLLLTPEQIRRTITVRIPAMIGLAIMLVVGGAAWLLYAAACFIGGSFYGLANWAVPPLIEACRENLTDTLSTIISGELDR